MSATENFLFWAARQISGCYDCPIQLWCQRRFLGITVENKLLGVDKECISEIKRVLSNEIKEDIT